MVVFPKGFRLVLVLLFTAYVVGAQTVDSILVNFDVGQDSLTRLAEEILQEQHAKGSNHIDSIAISAHTDADGSDGFNMQLSRRRAERVQDWFITHGYETVRFKLDWKGESDSTTTNVTLHGKARNRRATVLIYRSRSMREVSGYVRDSLGAGLTATLKFHGRDFTDSTMADSSGRFAMMIPDSSVVGVDIFAPGYLYETKMFNSSRARKLEFPLKPIKTGVKFALHRFYFVGNKAVLLPESESELIRLLRFLELNPTVEIAIEGHVNFPNQPKVDKDSWEYDLSWRRAEFVYDYLVENNVNSSRLAFEAFGNWQMVFPRANTPEQMQKNRRVEIRIVDY